MRLFVALPLPEAAQQAALRACRTLQEFGTGRFVLPEQLHMTLAFLGEVNSPVPVIQALETIQYDTFPLVMREIGNFGTLYWAGIEPSSALSQLHDQLSSALHLAGFPCETRRFLPHVTLCRAFHALREVELPAASKALGSATFRSCPVTLYRSEQAEGRVRYSALYTIP